ncbi:SNAPC4 [Cordylochernes scorpioides]|uniref:SNAPC4 n=1 Tax=Cordylochernes scorpioides TaxID=51811 RepID=A0ABY6KLH5_9ARAC|nr:SNAPC4 [Cordylochernes scorpioides]
MGGPSTFKDYTTSNLNSKDVCVKNSVGKMALDINLVYQKMVEQLIIILKKRLKDIKRQKNWVNSSLMRAQVKPIHSMLFTSPYFKNYFGMSPKPNQDSITKTMNNEFDAYTWPSKRYLKLAEFPLKMILVKDAQNFKGLMKMQKITDLIKENPRTTLLELEQDTGISKTTIGRIVTEDLKLKKTPAKFIPRFLTIRQKLSRLATCENMLEMTRTDPEWKDKIITGYETWVYGNDPETKRQSAEWRARFENTRKLAYEIMSMFGSTYRCEQLFSLMKGNKSPIRSRITDVHLGELPLADIEIGPIGTELDWMTIATKHNVCEQMKDHHSPEECKQMWNNFLHPSINKKPWTKEEDSQIVTLAKSTGGREWQYIASQLKTNRTAVQCLQRYKQALSKDIYRGKMEYMAVFSVANYMEGRGVCQIKSRWYGSLCPNRTTGKWSPKEDMTFKYEDCLPYSQVKKLQKSFKEGQEEVANEAMFWASINIMDGR